MRRGDIITVAVSGDYDKPRPAVIVQSDRLNETESVLICQFTSVVRDAPLYRLRVEPTAETGLHEPSDIMIDKMIAVRRSRTGPAIGRLPDPLLAELGVRFALVVGLAD